MSDKSDSTLSRGPSLTFEGDANSKKAKSINSGTSTPSLPKFDPRALLNPKAAAKRSREDDHVPAQSANSAEATADAVPSGMGSMIERMHKLDRREDQPQKRRKQEPEASQDEQKATFAGGGKGTVLGAYVKEKIEEGKKEAATATSVVDLTGGECFLLHAV